MSSITPSDIYYKSRRFSIMMSGLLLLSSMVGIQPTSSNANITLFDFSLANPEYLPLIFFILSAYGLWQFAMAWFVQASEIRAAKFNKIDLLFTLFIGFVALISFVLTIPFVKANIEYLNTQFTQHPYWANFIVSLATVLLSTISTAFSSGALKKSRKNFDKNLFNQEIEIGKLLTSRDWVIWFDRSKDDGKKDISFDLNGDISKGRNQNECKWRIRNGLLEIANSDDKIFSRFCYNFQAKRFEHTNDEDTLSLKSQIIYEKN